METSTAGATSRTTSDGIRHNVELVERHSLSIRAGDLPDNGAGAIDVLRLHAQAYARDRGFEITGGIMARVSTPVPDPAEARIAVEFDVVVGKGELSLDRPEDDRWAWSYAAADHNWKLLDDLFTDPEDRPRPRRRVSVHPAGAGGAGGGNVVPMPGVVLGPGGGGRGAPNGGIGGSGGGMPGGWMGGPAIRGKGISSISTPGPEGAPGAADQRPPWLRRGDGWDEDDAPGWGDHPPLG